ncbi:helix-turn-helix domain-containing protein [Virgibacillus flavescens]|uniref:helix-turn-helix domain-containing protein n=1 Tax=Virgibacillus flavescens TaxID=1611422 RepID=UPI003D3379FA
METGRIGRRIKAFRKLKGYTQIDLAKALHVSISELRGVERGMKEATDSFLDQVAVTLAIAKEEIIGETDDLKEAE